jgi:hypothetical protein
MMPNFCIVIPTCKSVENVAPLINDVSGFVYPAKVFASCLPKSAAINRNFCNNIMYHIDHTPKYIISMDDDCRGFYPGFAQALIRPLEQDESIMVVSARLINEDGTIGAMTNVPPTTEHHFIEVEDIPTACYAYRLAEALPFDERFQKSGYEDVWWCRQMIDKHHKKIVVNNRVKIIHLNERKGQDETEEFNRKLYEDLCNGKVR